MKPNFALSLSFDGIRLLRRAYLGWHQVGEVSLDTPDLPGELADLRAQALKFAPGGITTKLIIPDDQIKYLDLPTDDTWAKDRAGFVRAALADATPYDVSDLAYDWSVADNRVKIAVVARDTLTEAESFAADHDFSPVSFVAQPTPDTFAGEPFFGETAMARQIVPDGESIERDMTRLHVIPVPTAPTEAAGTETAEQPETPPVDTPEPAASDAPEAGTAPASGIKKPPPTAEPVAAAIDSDGADADTSTAQDETTTPDAGTGFADIRSDLLDSLGTSGDDEDDAVPEGDTPAATGFTSIRAHRGGDAVPDAPRLFGVSRLSGFGDTPDPAPIHPEPGPSEQAPSAPPLASPKASPSDDTAKPTSETPAPTVVQGAGAGTGAFFSVRRPGANRPSNAASRPTGATSAKAPAGSRARSGRTAEDEKQRMTVFGAREQEVGGKPRFLGLILTAVLLLFLVGVAAWASIFLDDGLAGILGTDRDSATRQPVPDPEDPITLATGATPTPNRVVTADLRDTPAGAGDGPATPETPAVDVSLTPQEARTQYAATGIWQMSPDLPDAPTPGSLGRVDPVTTDAPVARSSPSTLPQLVSLETVSPPRPLSDARPPDIGLNVEEDTGTGDDPAALVEATPDGALTPEGVQVFAGRPETEPPRDMARTEGSETPDAAPDSAQDADDAEDTAQIDTALAAPRPRLRPEGLAPEDTESQEIAAASDSDAIAAAVAAASTANLGGQTETDTPDLSAFENPTAQAVAVSLTPSPRPSGFAAKVAAAREARASRPVSTEQVVSVARPSSASVSRNATEKDTINLRDVNLIGVYGSPSSRRALVRLSNGRYKKVKVGDRLDGGRVSAIGDSELRYKKRGRDLILKMPRG